MWKLVCLFRQIERGDYPALRKERSDIQNRKSQALHVRTLQCTSESLGYILTKGERFCPLVGRFILTRNLRTKKHSVLSPDYPTVRGGFL